MFDPSKFTILLQAAGGSGDWRFWHYVVADGTTLDDVQADGFFTPMASQITPNSIVFVVAPTYVAQLVLVVKDDGVKTVAMALADVPEDADLPHVQGVPGQADGNQPIVAPADPEA